MSTSTMRLIIQGNSSSLTAAARAGGQSLQNLNNQAHAAGTGLQQMGTNATAAQSGITHIGTAANASAQSVSRLARAGQALRSVARSSHEAAQLMLNKYTALGAGAGASVAIWRGASLDRTLLRIKRTAGATKAQADQIRNDLMKMSTETGTSVEELVSGFSTMIQSGQTWDSAKGAIGAINQAVALTGANADDLAKSLAVAAKAFNFDLSQPGKALEILDKMIIAGDLGSAELEDLSGIFAKVGVNSKSAGFSMEQTLALTEVLSGVEMDKERLGTLVDSTTRMFTNQRYMKDAAKATGVKFYEANGSRRDPAKVLNDLAAAYKKLRTDKERDRFIDKTIGKADVDTIKGFRTLLSGNSLADMKRYEEKISGAPGEIKNKMEEVMGNAASQLERLLATGRKIADEAARPVNAVIARYGKLLADHQDLLKNIAIGAGILLASAVAIATAAKLIGAWRTVRSVFGGGGAGGGIGGGSGGLGGLGERGSTPGNPVYVWVVNGNGGGGGNPASSIPDVLNNPIPTSLPGGGNQAAANAGKILRTLWKAGTSRVGLGIAGAGYAAYDEGGDVEYTTKRVIAQQVGAQIGGYFYGKPGEVVGQILGDQGMKLFNDHDRAASGDATRAAEKELAKIEVGKRYSGVQAAPSDHAIAPPIQLNLYNSIDAKGQVEARLEGSGPGVIALRSESLGPSWVAR